MSSSMDAGLITLCFVGTAALVIFYRSFVYPKFMSPLRLVPGPPRKKLQEQLKQFNGEFHADLFFRWANEYGPIFRLAGGPLQGLVVSSRTGAQRILVGNCTNYQIPMKELLGWAIGGFFALPAKEHKKQRRYLNTVFSLRNLISNTGVYYNTTDSLITIFRSKIDAEHGTKNGNVIFIYQWLDRFALDNVCEAVVGFKLDSLRNPACELYNTLDDMSRLPSGNAFAPWELLARIPGFVRLVKSDWVRHSTLWHRPISGRLGPFFTFMRCLSTLRKTASVIKTNKIQEDSAESVPDIISVLKNLQSSDCTDVKSDIDIEGNIVLFWNTGRATIALRTSWALWLLANDQQCQKQLRDEVTPLLSRDPRPDYRSLDRLKWLDCVIMESLRLFSFGVTARVAENNDYIDGVFVPKGTAVIIPLDLLNVRTNIWGEDADKFNPARWLDSTKKFKTSPPLLSFLTGPHRCIAKVMALMQMKIVLSSLIANFEFEPAYEGQHVKGTPMIEKDGFPLRVRPIHPFTMTN